MPVTFLFPDALSLEPSAAEPVQALARQVFARFRVIRVIDDTSAVPLEMPWENWLRQQFCVDPAASIEAASAFADGIRPPCWRITPAHLHLGRDHVVLTNPTQLNLGPEHARALGDSLLSLLENSGLQLLIAAPDRWYLQRKDSRSAWLEGLNAEGWRAANGRNIDAYSPRGAGSKQWRRLVNEIQMTWHDHPINEQRATNGLPAVNSIWLDGFAMAATTAPYEQCHTDLIALRGVMLSAQGGSGNLGNVCYDLRDSRLATTGTSKKVLVAADPLIYHQPEGEHRAISLWRKIASLIGEPPANSTVILTGDRRLIELEFKSHDRWAFWRSNNPDPWFEWSNRDY